jgi:hypothetical protein
MFCVCNEQCDSKSVECHINITAVVQLQHNFRSAADQTSPIQGICLTLFVFVRPPLIF